jgi:hypothetical protein
MTMISPEKKLPGFFRVTKWRPVTHDWSRWTGFLNAAGIKSAVVTDRKRTAVYREGEDLSGDTEEEED